jgi:GGDEF domain-containing protein
MGLPSYTLGAWVKVGSQIPDSVGDLRRAGVHLALRGVRAWTDLMSLLPAIGARYAFVDSRFASWGNDDERSATVAGLVELSRIGRLAIVAEDVDDPGSAAWWYDAGVTMATGAFVDRLLAGDLTSPARSPLGGIPLRLLARPGATLELGATARNAFEMMMADDNLHMITLIDKGKPVATLSRYSALSKLSGPLGYHVHARHPAADIADTNPLFVTADTAVVATVQRVADRATRSLFDDVVVVEDDGTYLGVVSVEELLRSVAAWQVSQAEDRDPLTHLPGVRRFDEELQRRVDLGFGTGVMLVTWPELQELFHRGGHTTAAETITAAAAALSSMSEHGEPFVASLGGNLGVLCDLDAVSTVACDIRVALEASNGRVPHHNVAFRVVGVRIAPGVAVSAPQVSATLALVAREAGSDLFITNWNEESPLG